VRKTSCAIRWRGSSPIASRAARLALEPGALDENGGGQRASLLDGQRVVERGLRVDLGERDRCAVDHDRRLGRRRRQRRGDQESGEPHRVGGYSALA
jgi:hypothetical protein